MSTRTTDDSHRIPAALRHNAEQIFKLTDPFCAEHLDAEYGELVRKLVAKQRRSIWYETDSGMTDDDDDSLCDTSFDGIGYALQVELLDEVVSAARREAEELMLAAGKRSSLGHALELPSGAGNVACHEGGSRDNPRCVGRVDRRVPDRSYSWCVRSTSR